MLLLVIILLCAVLCDFSCVHAPKTFSSGDRKEMINNYLNDFSSFKSGSKIDAAIRDVLLRIPDRAFLKVMDRRRPVIFTDFYDSGTARFASSQEVIFTKYDPPCCAQGFTILKLGLALEHPGEVGAIEGVVAHELAHRVLDHIRTGNTGCDAERQANALIKKWGFGQEYKDASAAFGQRHGDPVSCQASPRRPSLVQ
jgi:hypothetical protein